MVIESIGMSPRNLRIKSKKEETIRQLPTRQDHRSPETKIPSQTTMVSCEINAHSAGLQDADYLTAEPLSMPEKQLIKYRVMVALHMQSHRGITRPLMLFMSASWLRRISFPRVISSSQSAAWVSIALLLNPPPRSPGTSVHKSSNPWRMRLRRFCSDRI